jgi:hypothetical protein
VQGVDPVACGQGEAKLKQKKNINGGGGCKTLQLHLRVEFFNENLMQFGFWPLFWFEAITRK